MRKQLDPRIPILINNNVKRNHRSFVVLVGDKGRDQVCTSLHSILLALITVSDRESSLLIITSPHFCKTLGAMVLQEGSWLHQVGGYSSLVKLEALGGLYRVA